MTSLGQFLVEWTLRSSIVLAITLLAAHLLRHRSAALRHAVFTAGMIASLLVPALNALRITAFVPASMVRAVASFTRGGNTGASAPNAAVGPRQPGVRVRPAIAFNSPAEAEGDSGSTAFPWALLSVLWLAGALAISLRNAVGLLAARRMRARARPLTDVALRALADRVATEQGMLAPEVRVSDTITAPATVGCWRPVVLLPAPAISWSAERLRPVLAHEFAHVQRRDCLTSTLAQLACAAQWLNPLAWLVERRMRMERERACDDRALAIGVEPAQYGLLLLDVARAACGRTALPAGVLMMARPRELESRLLAIVWPSPLDRAPLSQRALATIVALTALLGTAAASRAASPPATTQEKPLTVNVPAQQRAEAQVAPARVALPPKAAATQPADSQRATREPDRRGDSLAGPLSERLPISSDAAAIAASAPVAAALEGPDSLFVRRLLGSLSFVSDTPEELRRDRATWALGRARDGVLVEPLILSLGDDDWRMRAYATWALGVAADRRAVPALVQTLSHPVWRLRAMGAWALLEIGDARASDAMIKVLDDEAWQVRTPAVTFIAAHVDAETATRLLQPRLNDRHIAVRHAAADAMVALAARTP